MAHYRTVRLLTPKGLQYWSLTPFWSRGRLQNRWNGDREMVECENSVHKHQKEGQELLPTKSGHTRVILLGVRARQTALADFLYFLDFSWIQRWIRASLITLIFAKSTLI